MSLLFWFPSSSSTAGGLLINVYVLCFLDSFAEGKTDWLIFFLFYQYANYKSNNISVNPNYKLICVRGTNSADSVCGTLCCWLDFNSSSLSREMIQCVCMCVLSMLVSSISQPAHIVHSGVVHKSDFAKMKHVKCSWCLGGCLKRRAIPLHIART